MAAATVYGTPLGPLGPGPLPSQALEGRWAETWALASLLVLAAM